MHILWVNENAYPMGGAEGYIRNTATLLTAAGHQNTLLYDVRSRADASFVSPFAQAYPMVDIPRQIAELKPDVIYIHRLEDIQLLKQFATCGVPAFRFVHDHKLFCLREHKYTAIGWHTCTRTIGSACWVPCLGFLNRRDGFPPLGITTCGSLRKHHHIMMRMQGVITGSQYMANHITAHGFDAAHVHAIPLYALPVPVPDVPRQPNLFVLAAQLVSGKGVDTTLQAAKLLNGRAEVVIFGTGRKETDHKAIWKELGLEQSVRFMGRIKPEELVEWLARAGAVLMPSRTPETFGLGGPEAFQVGTPVIASSIGGVTEWLQDGHNGLSIQPNNPQQLAEKMTQIMDHPDEARKIGQNAMSDYQQLFTPDCHIKRLLALFETSRRP